MTLIAAITVSVNPMLGPLLPSNWAVGTLSEMGLPSGSGLAAVPVGVW